MYFQFSPSNKSLSLEKFQIRQAEKVKEEVAARATVDSPNLLQHAGLSKETLAQLGYRVKGVPTVPINDKPLESLEDEDEDDDTSPLQPSILKKPKPMKRDLMEESRVEISPGLFTKRPSKSLEKGEKVEEIKTNLDPLDQSPERPNLKTVDLKHLLNEKNDPTGLNSASAGDTPEMPEFQTHEARLLSTLKKSNQRPSLRPTKAMDENQGMTRDYEYANASPSTPEMPSFQSQTAKLLSAKKMFLHKNKENTEPDAMKAEEADQSDDGYQQNFKQASAASSLCETPELPDCKTINLKSLLQKSQGTFL